MEEKEVRPGVWVGTGSLKDKETSEEVSKAHEKNLRTRLENSTQYGTVEGTEHLRQLLEELHGS